MGKWASDAKLVDESAAITFNDWNELRDWFDSCDPNGMNWRGNACPLIERLFVIGCYQVFRGEDLNEVSSSVYTDGYANRDFTILAEVPVDDSRYDLEYLPLWLCEVEGEEVALYPEEIFVRY